MSAVKTQKPGDPSILGRRVRRATSCLDPITREIFTVGLTIPVLARVDQYLSTTVTPELAAVVALQAAAHRPNRSGPSSRRGPQVAQSRCLRGFANHLRAHETPR